ncbi:MAG: hypothetical protein IPG88_11015 [Gemmatimonadetes bacterium]|nr:hypothetical protein [Gemmatimonadota bacterium]
MKPHLLIVSTGRTDVQVVVEGSRWEVGKEIMGDFHDLLRYQPARWSLEATTGIPRARKAKVEVLPSGHFRICTPKLDGILELLEGRDNAPTEILLLETRRTEPEDPRYAGQVLEARIHQRLGPEVAVVHCSYLAGRERVEDKSRPRDEFVRVAVAERIERSIGAEIRRISPSRITLALTGGFPMLDLVIEETVRLHALAHSQRLCAPASTSASIEVELVKVPEPDRTSPDAEELAVPESAMRPHVANATKRRALELLSEGHVLGAWGAAKALAGDDVEGDWVDVFESLYRWMSSLPVNPEATPLSALRDARGAVRAALHVELALRAENIPAATMGTIAFMEAAIWDHLMDQWLAPAERLGQYRLRRDVPAEMVKIELERVRCELGELAEFELVKLDHVKGNANRPFLVEASAAPSNPKSNGARTGDTVTVHDGGGCTARLTRDLLAKPALERFRIACDPLRNFRNDVAHNVPTPERMELVTRKMQERALWSRGAVASFLSQSLCADVLTELGVDQPSRLLDNLICEVATLVVPDTGGNEDA